MDALKRLPQRENSHGNQLYKKVPNLINNQWNENWSHGKIPLYNNQIDENERTW